MRRVLWTVSVVALLASPLRGTTAAFDGTTANPTNLLAAASSFYRARIMADAPISYWRLDETSGTTAADQMARNSGTYAGGYTLNAAGGLGHDSDTAAHFNGTDARVGVAASASLSPSARVSVEAWVKPVAITGNKCIVTRGWTFYLCFFSSYTWFGVRNASGVDAHVTVASAAAGVWRHLVGTYDGTTIVLYRNGVNIGQVAQSGAIDTTSAAVEIGTDGTHVYWSDGDIDEVAIYDTALTAAQVTSHYNRGL